MLFNHFKMAWRSLMSRRTFSLINITGMALGMTAFAFILQYVGLEKSVNGFHQNLPRMYRVLCQDPAGKSWPEVEPGWAMQLAEKFPAIQAFCRYAEGVGQGIVVNETNNRSFREKNICYGEGNFFSFFSFPLLAGQADNLKQADVVFISNTTAQKYFGTDYPIGKALMLHNQFGSRRYVIEGVFADMGEQSGIRFDMVFSMETLKNPANLNDNDWAKLDNLDSQFSNMFFLLEKDTDVRALEQKMNALRRQLQPEKDAVAFRLQAFGESHLAARLNDDLYHTGNVQYVYVLIGLGLLILLIAWFNYVNLSTATALRRFKEVGVRKAIGATRNTLLLQFLSETLLVNALALALAAGLTTVLQPLFNGMVDKNLDFSALFSTRVGLFGLVTLLAGTLLSGLFTANAIARFSPTDTLRAKVIKSAGGLRMRQTLVVAQFAISTALILCTVLIYSQLKYMQRKNPGVQTQQLLVVRGPEVGRDSTYALRKTAFVHELAAQSYVENYSATGSVPGEGYNFATAGFVSPKSGPDDAEKSYNFAIIDERFLSVYGLSLRTGRNFTSAECATKWNDNSKIIVNETALAALGLNIDEALTTKIRWDERDLDIIGVIKDYHHTSLQIPIQPILYYPRQNSAFFTVRLASSQLSDNIAALEKLYARHFPNNPFEYFFAADSYQRAYRTEQQYSRLFASASLWAILIACLGLFGLSTFMMESRMKEIGIRKVLGASVTSITGLLAKDFLKLVLIAIVVASPVAWYFMQQWLADFPYRVGIQWWMFALAGFLAVLIAFLTVGFQSVKAALANPVKSLRSE